MKLDKYSMGIGDRFEHQGKAQLRAIQKFQENGVNVAPVWNKSHREHEIIGTEPPSVEKEAKAAVEALGWDRNYYVDADHIGLDNVDLFIDSSNYFTLDVADMIGEKADQSKIDDFVAKYKKYTDKADLPKALRNESISETDIQEIAKKYLHAIEAAGKIYQHIKAEKGEGNFITEVSMDETENPQTPVEMFFILAAIAEEGIPAQTIAPKFSGEFYKGIDYVGDISAFRKEFKADLEVISYCVETFELPENLKISIHSGSDKFSIYKPIQELLQEKDAGLHIKTAGTTWLEEIHGLILSGDEGLDFAKNIYKQALDRIDELSTPYADVINIDKSELPSKSEIGTVSADEFANMLVNDLDNPKYNIHLRQLLHLSYKLPAENLDNYYELLEKYEETVAKEVTNNIYRHISQIFPGNN